MIKWFYFVKEKAKQHLVTEIHQTKLLIPGNLVIALKASTFYSSKLNIPIFQSKKDAIGNHKFSKRNIHIEDVLYH